MVGGQGVLAVSTRAAIVVAASPRASGSSPSEVVQVGAMLQKTTAISTFAISTCGNAPPRIDLSTFYRPNIRNRSGMTEGPICGCSISPIQACASGLYLLDLI